MTFVKSAVSSMGPPITQANSSAIAVTGKSESKINGGDKSMSEVEYVLNKKKLPQWLKNVRQEIANVQSGEPRWRTGPALHFEVGKAVPIHTTLERFQENPTKKNYDAFIAQASQDLGAPTGKGFATWGTSLWHTIKDGTPTPTPSKKFEAKLFDGLYGIFRVARIQLEPKQIEAFEKATLQLARTFSEEIHKEMREQLAETVAKLKKVDAPKAPQSSSTQPNVSHGYE